MKYNLFKKAFTLLELIFVIIIIAIIIATMIPDSKDTKLSEGATQLVSHIRYTQHLAMIDDQFDATDATWYQNLWQIRFNGNQYSIVSDNNNRFAQSPLDGVNLNNIDLNANFGATVALSGGCNGATMISFDHLGRPITGNLTAGTFIAAMGGLIQNTCTITLTNGTDDVNISIEPETGYAHIE